MLADNENDKKRWIGALQELHKILKKSKISDRSVYAAKQVYDAQLQVLARTNAATVVDRDRLLLGTDEGLYLVELLRDSEYSKYRLLIAVCVNTGGVL